jgi:hypothetical protein
MKSRWLVCRLNTLILIILIQELESSGSEVGVITVDKQGLENFADKINDMN